MGPNMRGKDCLPSIDIRTDTHLFWVTSWSPICNILLWIIGGSLLQDLFKRYVNCFGKLLFSLSDILCSVMINKILKTQNQKPIESYGHLIWLLNPLVINISTRGNADTIIALMTLLVLYYLLVKKVVWAAIWFGLVVHFKVYPIIYAIPIYFYIGKLSL